MIAALLIGVGFAPAFAAAKVINLHDEDEIFLGIDGPFCGEALVAITLESNSFIKLWDNGHFKAHIDSQFNLYNEGGDLVGTVPNEAINIQGNIANLPISGNLNTGGDGACVDGTPITGLPEFHCGNTLQRDGDLIAHSLSCL